MLCRIVAVAIQSVARVAFGEGTEEMGPWAVALQFYLQRIFPGCVIEKQLFDGPREPMTLMIFPHNGILPTFGFVLDCQKYSSASTGHLHEERNTNAQNQKSSTFCAIILKFGTDSTRSMTSSDFDWFKKYTFPQPVLLRPRRFAGLSTDIYNKALSELNLKQHIYPNPQDFETTIIDCLILFASKADYFTTLPIADVNLTIPGKDTHLLQLKGLELGVPESFDDSLKPNAVHPAHTKVCYDEDSYFFMTVPFVFVKQGAGAGNPDYLVSKLMIMRHVDEPPNNIENFETVTRLITK